MSGIVGIFARRGAPVDRPLLRALTDFLSYRGPDAQETWALGSIGLGHTLLRTVRESSGERQPASLDGQLCISADARLDRRSELIAEIEGSGPLFAHDPLRELSDGELILRSYAIWGKDCLRHLRGDFAFAIWDAPRRMLFCARDHFGVKPFFYADLGGAFLFSNTLDCVRAHPGVSDDLNERAIADFLLQGFNPDLETTSFRDIRRLPPAHSLVVTDQGIRAERYWSLPIDGRIRYPRAQDYVENFQVLFREAVADRLRSDRVGIWMSGGMDSSAVAATARGLSSAPSTAGGLRAYTMIYESLIPDRERVHAQQVADFLGIPIRYLKMDDLPLFGGLDQPALSAPEPVENPFFAGARKHYQLIAADCRVLLSGEGADSLMHFQMWPYVRDMFRQREWRNLAAEVPAFLRVRSFPWKGIRHRARRIFNGDTELPEIPGWISADCIARLELASGATRSSSLPPSSGVHPFAPMAHAFLSAPQWSAIFEFADPGVTHSPVETRHPFLDLRVVDYLLAIPPFPWTFQKHLLREAMARQLPIEILKRPKTPLAKDPIRATIGRLGPSNFEELPWDEESDRYLDRSALQGRLKNGHLDGGDLLLRPLCLNFWLRSDRRIRYKIGVEVRNG